MFKYVFATPETNLFQLVNEVRSRKEETNLFMRDSHEKELFTEKCFVLKLQIVLLLTRLFCFCFIECRKISFIQHQIHISMIFN